MKKISQLFLQGLFAVLPVAVTLAILFWLGATAEAVVGRVLRWLLPDSLYWPGLGLIVGFLTILGIGMLVNAYVFQRLGAMTESVLERIPLVKTIYNSVRDIARFASPSQQKEQLQRAVMIEFDTDIRLIGFITCKPVSLNGNDDLVAVYFPMSYQIGGYTLFVPESRIKPLDISVQDAMHMVLTAAITRANH